MTTNIRDRLLKLRDRKTKTVFIKSLDADVRIQQIMESDRLAIMKAMVESGEPFQAYEAARYVAVALVDEDGNRLFADNEIDKIRDMPAGVVQEIYDAIDDHFEVRSDREPERLEDTEKNLQMTPDDVLQSV